MISFLRKRLAIKKLEASMRPDPDARSRRMSQWTPERRQRYFDAVYGQPQSLRGRA
jgi:hypothetical protein